MITKIWDALMEGISRMSLWIDHLTVDDYNKFVLATVAIAALFLGPWMQWRIAKKQVQMQASISRRQIAIQARIAKRQVETQASIASRQIADNISTKRQNWIDELRKDSSEFLTVVGHIQELKRPQVVSATGGSSAENFKERLKAEMRAKELFTRIRLRLNPTESAHNKLVELIMTIAEKGYDLNRPYTQAQELQAAQEFSRATHAVVEHLQVILKSEWERVKRGDV